MKVYEIMEIPAWLCYSGIVIVSISGTYVFFRTFAALGAWQYRWECGRKVKQARLRKQFEALDRSDRDG